MSFVPMLAQSINPKQVEAYLTNNDWCCQQKLDGIRILITAEDGKVTGVSRSGKAVELPEEAMEPFRVLNGLWRFDCEFVGTGDNGKLWIFDLPCGDTIVTPDTGYYLRYIGLQSVFKSLNLLDNPDIKLLDLASTTTEKRALLGWCREQNAEGVMFKSKIGKYRPGTRSPDTLKAKFTETADCVVLEVSREGKDSIAVGVYIDGVLEDIGSVKLTTSQGLGTVQVGDVVEVRYLYYTGRLYQSVFLKFRNDKTPAECLGDQLKFTNRAVRGNAT